MASATRKRIHTLTKLVLIAACALCFSCGINESYCDMSEDGSVWLTVVRLSEAEGLFYKSHGRYGSLIEMTNVVPGLPPQTTSGRLGSYTIRIDLTNNGYVLRANPDFPRRRFLSSFYADETGLITYDRSGRPATPNSSRM
jgi:hypothetical protein